MNLSLVQTGDTRSDPPDLRTNTYARNPALQFQKYAPTDYGNAQRLIDRSGGILRYLRERKEWLVYTEGVWRPDLAYLYKLVIEAARSIIAEAARENDADKRTALLRKAMSSENRGGITSTLAVAQNQPGISVAPSELDKDPTLFGVRNGTVDLRTGELLAHDPKHLITKQAPVSFDPQAECLLWLAFLSRIFGGDPDLIRLVQQIIGICLTADVSFQRLVIFYGAGANGKSTLLNVVLAMLGAYGKQAEPQLLFSRTGNAHPTGVADLLGARLAVCTESNDDRSFDEGTVKRLTGGDRIKARFMGRDFFEFEPTHKLILATNHRPTVNGTDEGIWRRLLLIPFNHVIPVAERDPQLQDKLIAELSGILNWALEGYHDWRTNGLTIPAMVSDAVEAYRQEMDTLGQFLDECCVVGSELKVGASVMHAEFGRWLGTRGEARWSQKKFGTELSARGFESVRSGGGGQYERHGLALRIGE